LANEPTHEALFTYQTCEHVACATTPCPSLRRSRINPFVDSKFESKIKTKIETHHARRAAAMLNFLS
jgi:hypothetical protein